MPWKNGLGTTTEVVRFPANGEFDWRISIADVATDGPFSKFPGCDRVILTLAGAGMELTHAEPRLFARIGPLEPWSFSGDWNTECALVDGPIRDFNVITRRDAFTPGVSVHLIDTRASLRADGSVAAVYCVEGALHVASITLTSGETLIATRDDAGESTIEVEPVERSIVIVVRLTSVR